MSKCLLAINSMTWLSLIGQRWFNRSKNIIFWEYKVSIYIVQKALYWYPGQLLFLKCQRQPCRPANWRRRACPKHKYHLLCLSIAPENSDQVDSLLFFFGEFQKIIYCAFWLFMCVVCAFMWVVMRFYFYKHKRN